MGLITTGFAILSMTGKGLLTGTDELHEDDVCGSAGVGGSSRGLLTAGSDLCGIASVTVPVSETLSAGSL